MAAFERSAAAAADADTLARLTMQDALHSIQQCATPPDCETALRSYLEWGDMRLRVTVQRLWPKFASHAVTCIRTAEQEALVSGCSAGHQGRDGKGNMKPAT